MISIEKRGKTDIISFSVDRINALITEEIKESVTKVFETSNSKVILNLKGVNYIDSSGFGCFLAILKSAKNNYGTLKIACPEPEVMSLFKTLQLHTIFQIYEDIDECLRSFK